MTTTTQDKTTEIPTIIIKDECLTKYRNPEQNTKEALSSFSLEDRQIIREIMEDCYENLERLGK